MVDEGKSWAVGGVVEAVERAVVYGEAILPEVKGTGDAWKGWGTGGCAWVVEDLRRSVITTEGLRATSEVGGARRPLVVITAGALAVSDVSLVCTLLPHTHSQHVLPSLVHNVPEVVWRSVVGILNSKTRLLSASEEVLLFILRVIIALWS